jgi:flagellar motor switch protein FliM
METLLQPEATSRSRSALATAAPDKIKPCTYGSASVLESGRLAPLLSANEACSKRLTQALSHRLGLACEVTLQSSDEIPCRTFLQKTGDSAFIVSVYLEPQHHIALLQIDSGLLFPLVDLLLGGNGKSSDISRETTEIEDHIAKEIVQLICHELQACWQPFQLEVHLGTRQSSAQLQRMFVPADKALMFSFSVSLPETGGGIQLLLPTASSLLFLRPVQAEAPAADPAKPGGMGSRIMERLLDSNFGLELALMGGKVEANHLLNLSTGKILSLGISVRTPVVLRIGGREAFEAVPVRSGQRRGAQLIGRVGQSAAEQH